MRLKVPPGGLRGLASLNFKSKITYLWTSKPLINMDQWYNELLYNE
jgi:hypothetical protein